MMSWRRLNYIVLKTSNLQLLQNVWFITSLRRLIYVVLKMSNLQGLQEVWFITPLRRLIYVILRRPIKDVLKTSDL